MARLENKTKSIRDTFKKWEVSGRLPGVVRFASLLSFLTPAVFFHLLKDGICAIQFPFPICIRICICIWAIFLCAKPLVFRIWAVFPLTFRSLPVARSLVYMLSLLGWQLWEEVKIKITFLAASFAPLPAKKKT